MPRLAFYTFTILKAPEGHAEVQGMFDRMFFVFFAADRTPGFIDRARNEADWGPHGYPRFFKDGEHAGAVVSLSLWEDLSAVHRFSYSGAHLEAFKKRKEWLLPPTWPTYVAWWVADDHTPSWVEACQRLEHLNDHGSTAFAFDFKKPFDAQGQPTRVKKKKDAEEARQA